MNRLLLEKAILGSILTRPDFPGVDFQVIEITDNSYFIQQTYSGEVKEYTKDQARLEFYYQYDAFINYYAYRNRKCF